MESVISKITIFRITDKTKEWTVYGIGLLCLGLFATAAYSKVAEHETFLNSLSRAIIWGGSAIYISWLVPILEILVSILLIIPQTIRTGLYAFIGLMSVFTVYILSMFLWAEELPCHCNLIIEKLSWGEHIWLNLGFIVLAVYALWLGRAKTHLKK